MTVGPLGPLEPRAPGGRPAPPPQGAPPAAARGAVEARRRDEADRVQLSGAAVEFARWRGRLAEAPEPEGTERIARLRALVEAGLYDVPGEWIAAAMLGEPVPRGAAGPR